MKIYTKTGDNGQTSLFDGTRINKDDLRVESYGTIDELDSTLGLARNFIGDEQIQELIYTIQRDLFLVAAQLANPQEPSPKMQINEERILWLETLIDSYIAKMPQVNQFILPGSNKASAVLHVARTVCRRAERRIVSLSRTESVDPIVAKYVNRLSDCIYSIARFLETDIRYVSIDS